MQNTSCSHVSSQFKVHPSPKPISSHMIGMPEVELSICKGIEGLKEGVMVHMKGDQASGMKEGYRHLRVWSEIIEYGFSFSSKADKIYRNQGGNVSKKIPLCIIVQTLF